jgi:pyridoxal phosphate enzyme (YggS family)|tara:strand:+ start:780 stop:1430 length:651 start_codon:yes stop_codon:yes gene_type:complete
MHDVVNNLIAINEKLQSNNSEKIPNIIAVSKTFSIAEISPLINFGHIHFGENKVQEALEKWTDIKNDFKDIKLHMVGKLQSNKAKQAVLLFDYIHSLDNLKLAKKISVEQKKIKRNVKIFIQVNIGNEMQKNGIEIENLKNFYNECVNTFELDIVGLMCIPPNNDDLKNYFLKMKNLLNEIKLEELSMGMSKDFMEASKNGATFIRIGSKIFGIRN